MHIVERLYVNNAQASICTPLFLVAGHIMYLLHVQACSMHLLAILCTCIPCVQCLQPDAATENLPVCRVLIV